MSVRLKQKKSLQQQCCVILLSVSVTRSNRKQSVSSPFSCFLVQWVYDRPLFLLSCLFFSAYSGASILKVHLVTLVGVQNSLRDFQKASTQNSPLSAVFSLNPCPSDFLHTSLKADFNKIYRVLHGYKFWKIKL